MTAATPALEDAERLLLHEFADKALLQEALRHRSAAGRGGAGSNERLEFVGDRVLGLVVAEWIASRYPQEQQGALGSRFAHLVSRTQLAEIAVAIGLAASLNVASGEVRAGVKARDSVLADALEAVIGALYLDGGLAAAQRFIHARWAAVMEAQAAPPKDAKTALQEYALGRAWGLPEYLVIAREGPPHAPRFRVAVTLAGMTGEGEGGSKRVAERLAAADLLAKLEAA